MKSLRQPKVGTSWPLAHTSSAASTAVDQNKVISKQRCQCRLKSLVQVHNNVERDNLCVHGITNNACEWISPPGFCALEAVIATLHTKHLSSTTLLWSWSWRGCVDWRWRWRTSFIVSRLPAFQSYSFLFFSKFVIVIMVSFELSRRINPNKSHGSDNILSYTYVLLDYQDVKYMLKTLFLGSTDGKLFRSRRPIPARFLCKGLGK